MKTLYSIPVNPNLIWDYDYNSKEVRNEHFLTWYLARVLTHGTSKDLKYFSPHLIKKYLNNITLPKSIKKFWQWYFIYVYTH